MKYKDCETERTNTKNLSDNPTLQEVLKYIYDTYGEEIFLNKSRLINIFKDLSPKLDNEAMILEVAMGMHAEKYFININVEEREKNIIKFKSNLAYLLSSEAIDIICDAFSMAFGWKVQLNNDISVCSENSLEELIIEANLGEKEAIKLLADGINPDDYSIEVSPEYSDEDKISKYRIIISALKTEQYIRFVLPYDISDEYTEDMFREDLNDKIVHSIRMLQESCVYNSNRRNRFSKLSKGDTFEFGRFEGSVLNWKVIRKDKDTLYAIADKIICNRIFDSNHNNIWESSELIWESSELRNWLNNDFYNSAFNETEKKSIAMINSDNITLLSKDEAENLMSQNERKSGSWGSWWWLRSAAPIIYFAWVVNTDGTLRGGLLHNAGGVRPALNLKF